MIKSLQMINFKCYKNTSINFQNFNVLCGPNSSGKSSINQAILFLLQNNHGKKDKLVTNGKFVHFDEFEEIKNVEISSEKSIKIKLINDIKNTCSIEIKKSETDNVIECVKIDVKFLLKEEDNIFYLSADRIGPEDVYDKYNGNKIGFHGENAVGFIAKYKDAAIEDKYVFDKRYNASHIFVKEVNYWLEHIIGEQISASDLEKTDRARATYSKAGSILQVRNKNTGSGLSYVISIVAMVLSLSISQPNCIPTFIIENPEIHLHPHAQVELMRFLMFMSKFCQVIIETHSDHIIKNVIDNGGQVIKLANFEPVYYNKKTRTILPTTTIGEIKWTIFDLPTIDFHTSVYAYLQYKYGVTSVNLLDDNFRRTNTFKHNKKIYDTRCKRYGNKGLVSKYETLPTYIRNVIDHPKRISKNEPPRKKYRNTEAEFEKALKTSIQCMLDIIKEKGW